MRIDVNEQYMVTLREVYNPVIIRDESAGGVAVCERDGKIEVTWLKAGEDTKEQIANSPASPVQHSNGAEPAEICLCDDCVVESCDMRGEAVECSGRVTESGKLRHC
jgi:hypothetical protein